MDVVTKAYTRVKSGRYGQYWSEVKQLKRDGKGQGRKKEKKWGCREIKRKEIESDTENVKFMCPGKDP